MSLTSVGQSIIDSLPFFGSTTDNSTLYRNRLAERSWEIILQHPLLGDPLARQQMQDLRQGEGIIDLVNTYAETALFYGLLGAGVFTGFILMALGKTYRSARELAKTDPDRAILGASLVACILGMLLMLADTSFMLGIQIMYYVLGGLATGYVSILKSRESGPLLDAEMRRNRGRGTSRFEPAK
jgi:O-antigen ligase